MAESTIWWLGAGALVTIELLSGTFYFLMLSIGVAAGAIAAHLGANTVMQMVAAAVVGGGAVVAWRAYKQSAPQSPPAGANRDVNLDVGETVQVDGWNPDGTGAVKYRGAHWDVELIAGATPLPGRHEIVEVVGNRLLLRKL